MLIQDFRMIGNKLLAVRKRLGLTQSEAAEAAGLSDRTYADIERGTVNMRVETALKICGAFGITPDELFTENTPLITSKQSELFERLNNCTLSERKTALSLLEIYLDSIKQ